MSDARADAFPEATEYRDTGCRVHPHCLTCPLEWCIEEPGGWVAASLAKRDAQIRAYRGYVSIAELAARYGLGKRTINRIFATPEC